MVAVIPFAALPTSASEESFTIALSLPNLNSPFYEGLADGAQDAGVDLEAEVVLAVAEDDLEIEMANVESLIDQEVDAIVFRPVDAVLSLPVLAVANEADIPVILVGPMYFEEAETAPEIAGMITIDDVAGGEMAADVLCEALSQTGTALELVEISAEVVSERNTSFEAAMAANCADVTLMPFDVTGLEDSALTDALVEFFRENDVNGVFGFDSAITQAALEASIVARSRGIIFVGFDITEDSLAAVLSGRLRALITPSSWELGYSGVETSLALLNGEEIPESVELAADVLNLDNFTTFRACKPWMPNCKN
jgi:ABC-type sugar transport system substrate-binding protein